MNDKLDNDIQEALQAAPMDGKMSAELKRRLRVLARETAPRPLWQRPRFSLPVGMAASVAAVVVVTTMLPTKASAKSFEMIVAAAQSINAFQFSIISEEGPKREKFSIAGSDGRVVMRTDESAIMEFDAGAMSIYDPKENKVMRFKYGGFMDAETIAKEVQSGLAEGLKEMDLKKMLRDYSQKYGQDGIRISPVTREGGRSVYHVTLASKDQPERVEMTVDAATDLPERLEVQARDEAQNWRESVIMEMRFGARVDPRLLRSAIPAGAKVEEIDLGSMIGGALKGLENFGSEPKEKAPKRI